MLERKSPISPAERGMAYPSATIVIDKPDDATTEHDRSSVKGIFCFLLDIGKKRQAIKPCFRRSIEFAQTS